MLKLNPNESNHRLILQFKQGLEITYGNQAPSVYFPSQFLHVHSNLTVPTYFNGKLTNSLRVIRLVQNKVNKYVRHIAPKQPQYFEVIQKSISQIEIELRDDQGRILCFPNGSGIRTTPPPPPPRQKPPRHNCMLDFSEHTSSPAIFAFFTTLLVIMDYVRSNKGGMKLLFQNNLYVKQKALSSGAVCWECDQRRNKFACKAKLHVLDDQVIKQVNDHTHVASRAVVESSKVRNHPELFFQLYTIHSCTANRVLPCVYALLPNKQQATYTIFFEILKQLQHTLAPTNLMVDFEIAILNAIDTSFPGTSKKGCFFHFSQAIFRKIQSLGLQNRYKDDENSAHKVRMLAALVFVPLPDVIDAFESVADEFPLMLKK